jgi:hypothetical protein
MILGLGIFSLPLGFMWLGQGLGIIRWPKASHMIDHGQWAINGLGVMMAGALMLVLGLRWKTGKSKSRSFSSSSGSSGRRRRTKR